MRMHTWSLVAVALLLFAMAVPAHADAAFDDLTVRSQSGSAVVHIVIINPGAEMQNGPLTLQLYVRKIGGNSWTLLKTWNDIQWIHAGEKVTRDYFNDSNPTMASLVAAHAFHVRAVLSGAGLLGGPVEARKSWKKGQGGAPDNLENLP